MAREDLFEEEEESVLSPDEIERLRDREVTRAELFRQLATPDLQRNIIMGKFSPFTKELKTSNIRDIYQLNFVVELSDIAREWFKLGAEKTATTLIAFRDTLLSAAPSLQAKFLTLATTEYSVKKISEDKRQSRVSRLFKSGGEEYG